MTRQLLNTLFVQTQGAYLRLEGDTVRVEIEQTSKLQVPLHHLSGFVVFGNVLLSPFLLKRSAEDGRSIVWMSRSGRFVGRLEGPVAGNVLLRRAQHAALNNELHQAALARAFVSGKLRAARHVLARALRDGVRDEGGVRSAVQALEEGIRALHGADEVDTIRGIEGQGAAVYFAAFPALIAVRDFVFETRNRRPPLDPVNALLSFVYTLLSNDCAGALESVGLDPQVGFLHALRPGRPSLALDLLEEFRAGWADRLVLTLINRKQIGLHHFEMRPGGAVYLNETGRKEVLTAYQKRKQAEVRHRLFTEPVPLGLIPYVQARLLARHLRGDLDHYPPFRTR